MGRRWPLIVLALLTCACAEPGPAAPSPSPTPAPVTGGTLRVGQDAELLTLDPEHSTLVAERQVYYNLYDSLIGVDPGLRLVPELAASWSFPDLLTLVLNLRHGVRFHDGTDFDADAVKLNLDRYRQPGSERANDLASVASVEVRDAYTVALHLKLPDGTLLSQLVDRAGMMLSPAALRGEDVASAPAGAGTGPFEFVEWKPNDHLTLRRNPSYWMRDAAGRRLPYLDQVVYYPQVDRALTWRQLRSGGLDAARALDGSELATARSTSGVILRSVPGTGYNGVYLDTTAPPFDDPARRRAFALAIDRARMLTEAAHGFGAVSLGPITPSSWAFDPSERIYAAPDPAAARATATGFAFSLKVAGDRAEDVTAARLVREDLAEAGITATIVSEPFSQVVADATRHDFQALMLGWSGRIDPDGNVYRFHTAGAGNFSRYSNTDVDQFLDHARSSTDQPKRRLWYQEAQRIVVRDAPFVFTYDPAALQITTAGVHGTTLYPDGINRFASAWKT